ncbi:MAG: OsmC family protein [Chloroflexi bacterium]|nr:OsmC family protein [Chloroflexota bacterium]
MNAKVTWKGKNAFEGTADSGKVVIMDSDSKEKGIAPGPMELVAISLAGCTAMDVISILEKKQQKVTSFEVKANADRSEDYPKIYTRAELVYEVTGESLDEAAVVRAIDLSMQKYCPVHAMLEKAFPISERYEIYEDKGNGERELVKSGMYQAYA